jgi:preprotein translocase subunit SecG
MHMQSMAALTWLKVPLLILFVLSGIVLILIVLIQTTKGGGLAGAFGMGGDASVLGTRAGTFLGKVTAVFAAVFLLLALVYSLVLQSENPQSVSAGDKNESSAPAETE